jgi:hypothetical protein
MSIVEEAPWVRSTAEGLLGQWHMPAGRGGGGVLSACDRTFSDHAQLEERSVGTIPPDERCPVCQGVQVATERSPIVTPGDIR